MLLCSVREKVCVIRRGYEAQLCVSLVNRTASCYLKTRCRLGERGCSSSIIGFVRKYSGHGKGRGYGADFRSQVSNPVDRFDTWIHGVLVTGEIVSHCFEGGFSQGIGLTSQ